MPNLRQTLYAWRDNEAAKRGVEHFRILPNSALDEIVKTLPRTKEELTTIKGIKDAKYHAYGKALLAMIDESQGENTEVTNDGEQPRSGSVKEDDSTIFSVSTYLDIINRELWRLSARVSGEITSFKFQGSALYLGIRDKNDESTLNVFMWNTDFELAGIELAEGLEVIVDGRSEVYKPSGRLSFRAQTIELVGEGALKKAYDALKKKLDTEGLFSVERKKTLTDFPEHIGLVTSKQGAVIHDFLNNLGKHGYHILFKDSRVEGALAVKDLLSAISVLKTKDIDALVIVRGGGSLESLQAFNNELVVRAIADFPVPVICAIGHDKDVPLAQLAADIAPSTPTACTAVLNRSWEEGAYILNIFSKDIISQYQQYVWERREELERYDIEIRSTFQNILGVFARVTREFTGTFLHIQEGLVSASNAIVNARERITQHFAQTIAVTTRSLDEATRTLRAHDPLRQLKLGYSLLTKNGKVVRSVHELPKGTSFEARLSDGTLRARSE